MKVFLIHTPEGVDRIQSTDHASAARRWARYSVDPQSRGKEILVTRLGGAEGRTFHVEIGPIATEIA